MFIFSVFYIIEKSDISIVRIKYSLLIALVLALMLFNSEINGHPIHDQTFSIVVYFVKSGYKRGRVNS
jgi:hypothetical protein